ncbi:S41 family peptidase [Hymenobacter sp. GOD-10R]|uniref:S41 family peptidase n=1 Tax=Hymenobacter sp. GOD-10R TaxID=3093922 RepID=UPI002D77B566|nr:S41 family peptidase [Hymenobacter sp. GOD-10R]WRQ28516.1 S41 family peptidase [Hymenobacter sp. GOD-10R]
MRLSFLTISLLLGASAASAQAPTPRTVQNLETFTRLYGYVRYFHPSDEAAAIDWDKFAVLGAQRVEQAQTEAELKKTLLGLFQPIAPTLQLIPAGKTYLFKAKDITPPTLKGYEVISWQHQGMGQGNAQSPYHSRRTHRPEPLKDPAARSTFGTLTKAVDATPYRGKSFRYTALVRNTSPQDGPGALWARVDLPYKGVGFFDNMVDRPIQSKEWAEYEIKGTIDPQATFLYFGSMLIGSGQIQVDNMQVAVQEDGAWKTVFATGFEEDEVKQYPRSISGQANTSRFVANNSNDAYSFLVSATDAAQEKHSVVIRSLDKVEAQNENFIVAGKALFPQQAQIGEVVQEDLGSGLRCVLPLALYGTKDATFPAADNAALEALQTELNQLTPSRFTGNDRAVRLADVVITWNVFQHFYPYFAVTNSNWPTALPEALRAAYPDQSEADNLKVLQRLTAHLHDGHVRVSPPARSNNYRYLPIRWEWVQNQLIITHVANDSLGVQRGDIVTMINGQPAAMYFREAEQYISAATPGWLHYRAAFETLMGPPNASLALQVQRPNGESQPVTLHFNKSGLRNNESTHPMSRLISPSVYYLNLDRIPMDAINELLPELAKMKTIICDLRGYPKGNHPLISHLLSGPDTAAHWMRVPRFIYPDQKKVAGYDNMGWAMKPSKPHLSARIIFITDGSAISYAESYMGFIEGYKLATIIGQPTAGTNGNINPFTLPGNYSISWTGMEVRKHDGSQHHGVGIKPNIYLEKTIQGVREGRDEFLEKAIELAKAN